MSFQAKFRSWYPAIAQPTGRVSDKEVSDEGEDFEPLRGATDVVFVRTSMVRFESPDTSTVNMMASAPSCSTFRMRASEARRSLLR